MASKIQKLKRWLCRVLECEQKPPVITRISLDCELIRYDDYDIEVQLTEESVGLVVNVMVYLKGSYVLEGVFLSADQWEWTGGMALTAPSYKTRKYIRDYALTKLSNRE